MTVSLSDLIAPTGELVDEMFPGQPLNALVDEWLSQAIVEAAVIDAAVLDKAVRHWVYGRAYRTIARRIALQPNSASAEGISESYGIDRIRYFEHLAATNEALFEGLKVIPATLEQQTGTRSLRTWIYF